MRFLRINILIFLVLFPQLNLTSQDLSDYLIGLPKDIKNLGGYELIDFHAEENGALILLECEGISVTLAIMEVLDFGRIESALEGFQRDILSEEQRQNTDHSIDIDSVMISIDPQGKLFIELQVESFTLNLKKKFTLEYGEKISGPMTMEYQAAESRSNRYNVPFEDITIDSSAGSAFPGWDVLGKELRVWAEQGMKRNDQSVMGTVLEISLLSKAEIKNLYRELIEESDDDLAFNKFGISIGFGPFLTNGESVQYFTYGLAPEFHLEYRVRRQSTAWGFGLFGSINLIEAQGVLYDSQITLITLAPEIRYYISMNQVMELYFKVNGGMTYFLMEIPDHFSDYSFVPFISGGLGTNIGLTPWLKVYLGASYSVYFDKAMCINGFVPSLGFISRF